MKKVFGFRVLFMAVVTALIFLSFSNCNLSGSLAGVVIPAHDKTMRAAMTNRKLKENSYDQNSTKKRDLGNINLEDYHPIDPVPSSKASTNTGPIEHGTPLIPYIPHPTPPSHPRHGGSP